MNRNSSSTVQAATLLCGISALLVWGCKASPSAVGGSGEGGASGSGRGGSSAAGDDASSGYGGSTAVTTVSVNFDVKMEPDLPEEAAAPTADLNCGLVTQKTKHPTADVLLVLDRSLSMDYSIAGSCYCNSADVYQGGALCTDTSNCTTRWNATKAGLKATLSNSKYINWGLKFFMTPKASECGVSAEPEVPIGPDAAPTIQSTIDSADKSLSTPTTAAINAAVAYLKTVKDDNKKYILLATDGEPNCGGTRPNLNTSDVTNATAAMTAAKDAGFSAYVIGIGTAVDTLSKLAKAGGDHDYFPATSADQLTQALTEITKIVASCSFHSDKAPDDPDNVAVYVNGQRISRSDDEGWKYGNTQQDILLTGKFCKELLAGTDTDVQIIFGCKDNPYFPPDIY
jgi:hypothetical protein